MYRNRGIAWKNFAILMSFMTVLVLALTFFIYKNAIKAMEKEMCNASFHQISQIENDFLLYIQQINRLASALCVEDNVRTFWSIENPDKLEDDFYIELKSVLKREVYSMNDAISSIVLYAPNYNRIIDENMTNPVTLRETNLQHNYNAQWINWLEPLDGKLTESKMIVRAVNDNYPYVLTMIKQCIYKNSYGALAVDIDLKKLYSVIMPDVGDNLSVWILDSNGNIIVQKNKKQLYADKDDFVELNFFDSTKKQKTEIWEKSDTTIVYSQKYNEETGFYVVSSSTQSEFDSQMKEAVRKAVILGIGCVFFSGIIVMIFVHITNKPWENILSLLENPSNYEPYMVQNEKETQMIVDYIVSSLQLNNNLKKELEERVELLSATKLQALKAQINPHFLFNTLNAIVMMIDMEVEDSQAAKLTVYLADILHYSLSNEDLVSLQAELEYARKYLYILENRYQGRFETEICVDPQLLDARVPKLLLQPLLENAVFHGVTAKNDEFDGRLQILGKKESCCFADEEIAVVHIEIIDNGAGMSQENIDRILKSIEDEHISMEHIGISNVAKRLALIFPQQNSMKIDSKIGEHTKVSMIFPFLENSSQL